MQSRPSPNLGHSNPSGPNTFLGWDIGIAAFSLACMTTGFWRLWPGAVVMSDAPLGPMILKAGLAALGFVALATRWEDTCRALSRNPVPLLLLALVCSSSFWAIVPADALRNAILLILIWVFGIALTLRFKSRELAEICAFAGVIGLIAQFAGHQAMPPVTAFDGDVAFAILGTAWAAGRVPTRRMFWLLALGCCCVLALAARDFASLGAGIGLLVGSGVAQLSAIRARRGAVSIIVTAWVLVALIIGVTLFALFGAEPITARISDFFTDLGSHVLIGQGFGSGGQSIASALGAGLGIVGVALAGLMVFASLFQVLLSQRQISHANDGNIAIWFGALCAILINPAEVAIFGPIMIVFAATSFSISLSCVPSLRPRRSLCQSVPARPPVLTRHATRASQGVSKPSLPLNAMGLRPRS